MEYDPKKQKAYNNLGLDLDELYCDLIKLRNKIRVQIATTKEINDRIDTIINNVDGDKESLGNKAKPIVRKDISIAEPLQEVNKVIAKSSPLTNYSSDDLNALLNGIELIWKEQIKITFDEAMKSETS
jgi:hypothetical protein